MSAPAQGASIPLKQIIAYGLPAIPLAALTLPLYILVPTFYAETIGLPLAAVGTALMLVRLFDAINDPLIGYLSDRVRPRFGRRRTLFALSIPVIMVGAVMVFWPPSDASTRYLALWGAVLSVGYTAAIIPLYAWGAEMAGSYRTRTTIAGWREAMTLTGTLMAIALPFTLGIDTASGFHGLALLAVVIAIALPLSGGVTLALVPEPAEYTRARLPLRDAIGHLASNRPFVRLIAAFFLNGLANGIPATLFMFFVADYLGAGPMRAPLLFVYFACGVAGVPLAAWAARRLGKHRAWGIGMIVATLAFAPAPLLSQGDVAAFAVICAITGLLVGFDLALPAAIQADVIDVDTAVSGEQRSGTYFAAWGLATKLSLALAVGITFPLIGAFGFAAGGGPQQTGAGLAALAITYGWVPIGLKLAAIALMWNFPIDETRQAELRRTIEAVSDTHA